jgi:glycylpeptide N-tetradecanoyltransferase
VYTAGVVLPRPVSRNRYFHRSLNPKKLIGIGFSRLQPLMTMARTIKLYKVDKTPQTPGIREFNPQTDAKQCQKLLMDYLKKFKLYQEFDVAEFRHWFTPRKDVVHTFVVEDPATEKITDMISFYSLPSSILNNPKYKTLRAAYSFYNVSTKTPWKALITDALILANRAKFDVFNALDVMENETFFKQLKFGIGDGHLQYYLYNWNCPEMEAGDVGLVLL